jgi:HEAT repeat protein
MLHRARSALVRLVAVAFACVSAQALRAENLPEWEVEFTIFRADIAVRATLQEGNTIQVEEVFMGPAAVGQKLPVERLLDLPRQRYQSAEDAFMSMFRRAGDKTKATSPRPEVSGPMMLFLTRNDSGKWETEGWGSGVKWLVDGKVYGYVQPSNPGPYYLVPDRYTKTEERLRLVIQAAIAKKDKFTAARSLADPASRIAALAPYLQPEENNFLYFAYATEAIGKAGPLAGPLLCAAADKSPPDYRRSEMLKALGKCRAPESVPYLLGMVERSAPVIKAIEPFRLSELSLPQRVAMTDWDIAVYVLAEEADPRAIPAFREALLWGAPHFAEHRIMQYAARGLQKLPTPENIPVLAQALSSIRASQYDWVAVEDCLQALREHRYPAAVPVLANHLKQAELPREGRDSREYNARIAHAALINIVGQDLGTEKEPWINWFEAQKKE